MLCYTWRPAEVFWKSIHEAVAVSIPHQDEAERAVLSLLSTIWILKDRSPLGVTWILFASVCLADAVPVFSSFRDLFEVAKYIDSG